MYTRFLLKFSTKHYWSIDDSPHRIIRYYHNDFIDAKSSFYDLLQIIKKNVFLIDRILQECCFHNQFLSGTVLCISLLVFDVNYLSTIDASSTSF